MLLDRDDIIDIIFGATLFGAGGGGTLQAGLNMLELIPKERQHINLVTVDTVKEDEYACMVAGIGSPIAMEKNIFSIEAVYVVRGVIDLFKKDNKDVRYIYSGEQGGFNTMVPLYAAMMLDMPVLDLDGNGRAVPELNTGLLPIYGIPTSPLLMANNNGDIIIGFTADPNDSDGCETIARQMCIAYGMSAGFSTWMMNKNQLATTTVIGQMTQSLRVGKLLRDSTIDSEHLIPMLKTLIPGLREYIVGTITNINISTKNGFDFGTIEVTSNYGEKLYVYSKNENILVKTEDGKFLLSVPEIISLISLETKEPLTNASAKKGEKVSLVGIPAHEKWWSEDGRGVKCWEPILKQFGYGIECVSRIH